MFFFITLLLYVGFTPLRDLYGIESRNGLFAKEMLTNGLSFVPCLHGRPYPDYPPLYFLLEYIFSLPWGRITTFSAVMPSATAAAALIVLVWNWTARISRHMAAVSCLILATTPGFWLKASSATIDMLLAMETFSAFYFFSKAHSYSNEHNNTRCMVFRGLGAASVFLACITKGPVGMVLPLGAWMLYLFMEKKWIKLYKFTIFAITLFLLFSGLYFIMIDMQGGTGLASKVLDAQVTGRVGAIPNKPWYYYLLFLLTSFLPWWALIASLPILIRRLPSRNKISVKPPHADAEKTDTAFTCSTLLNQCAAGMFFTIAIFSMAGSRHGRYLLPAFPFIAILMAAYINTIVSNACMQKDNIMRPAAWINYPSCTSEVIERVITMISLCLAASLTLNALLVQPFISRQESGRRFIEKVEQNIPRNIPVLTFKINPDGDGLKLALYSGRKPGSLKFTSSIQQIKQMHGQFALIVYDEKLHEIKELPAAHQCGIIAHGLLHRKKISAVMICPTTYLSAVHESGIAGR